MQNLIFKLREQDRSKTVFVNAANYKQTLDYAHKSGLDTSLRRDFMRVGFTARDIRLVESCGNSCGQNRVETCNWNTPVLYGMDPDYYVMKSNQLLLTALTSLMVLDRLEDIEVGIKPDLSEMLASASNDLSAEMQALLSSAFAVQDAYKAKHEAIEAA